MLPVSIVIATHNRCDELRRTLMELNIQCQAAEIIVVDNASADNTQIMVRQDFPEIRLIENATNEGVPAFSAGVLAASQPFVFLLDDDAVPDTRAFGCAVACLGKYPQIAIVACHVVDSSGSPVTDNWPNHPVCFWGCGAVLRKSALVGQPYMFDPRLLLHGTEMDLAVRLYARGYFIQYLSDAIVYHRFSSLNRSTPRRYYFLAQSAVWFAVKHLPLRYVIPAVVRHLIGLFFQAVKSRCLRAFFFGVTSALLQLRSVLDERSPVPREIARTYYKQVWEYEPLLFRVLRWLIGQPRSRRENPGGFPSPNAELTIQNGARA